MVWLPQTTARRRDALHERHRLADRDAKKTARPDPSPPGSEPPIRQRNHRRHYCGNDRRCIEKNPRVPTENIVALYLQEAGPTHLNRGRRRGKTLIPFAHIYRSIATYPWHLQQNRDEGDGPYRRIPQETSQVLQYGGCKSLRFRKTIECPDFKVPQIEEYPAASRRRIPEWNHELPSYVREIHRDIHLALQVGMLQLAVMGARP